MIGENLPKHNILSQFQASITTRRPCNIPEERTSLQYIITTRGADKSEDLEIYCMCM